ncbi:heavy-metal-associated domain-containing protein [Metabacillus herbersteinensis]|uniref:Heavy-metal-associated domain-containing protein n=1 Tax=Metabacillus herbersteinensis TaxID=283816 RepID=A0ABV6GC09_9BACI
MATTTIFVKEATSEPSIQTVETILTQMNGIERALVDVNDGEIKIEYNDRDIAHEQIVDRLEQHGLHIIQP